MYKILLLTHWYPDKNNTHKGIFIKNHAHCFDSFSDLTVVDFNISYSKNIYNLDVFKSNDDGLNVLHIHLKSRFYKFFYYALSFQYFLLLRILKREKIVVDDFDLIVSNVLFPNGIVSYKLAKRFKKKLIHIEHWSYLNTFLKKDIHKRKGLKTLKFASKIIVVSDFLKKQLKGYGLEDKIEIVPNVVSDNFTLREKEISPVVRFLAIANWNKPKNPFLFIEALIKLKNSNDFNFKLTMIGKGSQLDEIKQMNLPFNIEFTGVVKNEMIPFYFQKTDFFLIGSDFETFSIVAIEALQTGTPVIGSKVGVLPEVITEKNGVLCENTVESWIESIEKALQHTYIHENIARNIKGKFNRENITPKFEDIVRSIHGNN